MLCKDEDVTKASVCSLFGLFALLLPLLVLLLRRVRLLQDTRQLREEARKNEADEPRKGSAYCSSTEKLSTMSLLQAKESHGKREPVRAGLIRPDLHGMETYEIQALEFLKHGTSSSSSSSLLGICGPRGVGKTTLLRLLRSTYAGHRSSFDYVFYVRNVEDTVATLHGCLAVWTGLAMPPQSPLAAKAKIISSFLKNKTFLILLDDVRQTFDLAVLGLPVPLQHRQKVVFATRNQAVCTNMGCATAAGNTIQMQCLQEDDAWNLFRYCAGDQLINSHPGIKRLAKKIVAECRGFPGALCTVGRSMSNKTYFREWWLAYDELKIKRPLPNDEIQDMEDDGYPCVHFFEGEF